jgi:hypothetical protein
MPKRSSTASKRQTAAKRVTTRDDPTDPILMAARAFRQATGEEPKSGPPEPSPGPQKNPAAVALGKLGGIKGGKARAEKLSPRRRRQIAKRAAQARWKSKRSR